jgi:hypothetical protein
MKKIYVIVLFLFSIGMIAQKAPMYDKIIKKDYTILEVTISAVSETEVDFSYPNETIINKLGLQNVAKIIYKSGREQIFDIKENSIPSLSTTEDSESNKQIKNEATELIPIKINTIAVLPIPFVNSETLATSSEMAKFAQNDMYNKLIDKSANIFPLVVQDLRDTNSLLKKAGIDYSNIDEILIEDLQKILGVDHIVASKVSYVMTINQSNTNNGNTTINKKNENNVKVNDFSMSSSTQSKSFDYTVYFDIYKNGTKIFTESREPFFKSKDSWMDSMSYLLKRCPIYSKN